MSDDEKVGRDEVDALLRTLYAARSAGDLPKLLNLFAEDAIFEISGATHTRPLSITTAGSAGYRPWLALLLKTFWVTEMELVTVLIEGPKAAVHWRASIYSRITGVSVPTELIDLIEVRNGKVASYIEFFRRSVNPDNKRPM